MALLLASALWLGLSGGAQGQNADEPELFANGVVVVPSGLGSRLVVADLTGDGIEDAVVTAANTLVTSVSVSIGTGDGGFAETPVFVEVGQAPLRVAVAEVTGDAFPDLITAGPAGVTIVEATGHLAFGSPQVLAVGSRPVDLVAHDVTGDGDLDLVVADDDVASFGTGALLYLENDGSGNFGPVQTLLADREIRRLALGEVDGDEHRDLVAVADNRRGEALTPLYVLYGSSSGFDAPELFELPIGGTEVAIGDVTGDGRNDIAVANREIRNLTLLPASGGPRDFGEPVVEALSGRPQSVVIADLNGEGTAQLVVSEVNPDVTLVLDWDNAANEFHVAQTIQFETSAFSLADTDSDGYLDLLFINGGVARLEGEPDGRFATPPRLFEGERVIGTLPAAGGDEILSIDYSTEPPLLVRSTTDGEVATRLGAQLIDGFPGSGLGARVRIADIVGDENPDLLVGLDSIYSGLAPGSFAQTPEVFEPDVPLGSAWIFAEDVAGDAQAEVVKYHADRNKVEILTSGPGGLEHLPAPDLPGSFTGDWLGSIREMEMGDITGDGIADLLVVRGGYDRSIRRDRVEVSVLRGTGSGFLDEADVFTIIRSGVSGIRVDIGDITGDGRNDILLRVINGGSEYFIYEAVDEHFVLAGEWTEISTISGSGASGLATTLDADDLLDVVSQGRTTSGVIVSVRRGGTLPDSVESQQYWLPELAVPILAADLNGDGLNDLLMPHFQTTGDGSASWTTVLLQQASDVPPPPPTPVPTPSVSLAGPEVMQSVSCLAGNGRVDTNIVNLGLDAAEYRIEFEGLTARARTVAAGDWWRMPITGRPDGDYDVVVKRAGTVVSNRTLNVSCDSSPPVVTDAEVRVVNSCRADRGYILFQFVNPSALTRGWVIEFEGVPNRSTSALGWAQSVRAVTGRPSGSYDVIIRTDGVVSHQLAVQVDC